MARQSFRSFKIIGWSLSLLVALVFMGATSGSIAYADPPPSDGACVGCHSDNQRTLTLSSGEELPLLALPEELAASPHNSGGSHSRSGEPPISCTSCHLGPTRYRYPHPATPAHSLDEYTALAAETCQECHVYHNPLHRNAEDETAADAAEADLPNCVDCHGSHTVSSKEQIAETMPANCVDCHRDQTNDWAAELLAPRSGLGQGASGYVGSRRCLGCHTDNYLGWAETLHAKTIHNVNATPESVLADFDQAELPFGLADVAYVIGERWQQRFITETVEGDLLVLPGQWNIATQEWVVDHRAEGETVNWRTECSFCHVTGLDSAAWEFQEFGIGCEDCHGPGEAHADNPKESAVFSQPDDQVCGACHSRGVSPQGHPFPASYQPGDTLTDHFTFTVDDSTRWPDGSAKIHNQQYTDWIASDKMGGANDQPLSCMTCHTAHNAGQGPSQTVLPTNELCSGCHAEKTTLARHIPYHQLAITKRDFACNDCHMPLMATSAVAYDIHNHTFQQPNPQGSIEHGGVEFMPNACNQCHKDRAETPEWALETINWALENYSIVRTEYIFEPGPTPESPPVPTPLPSAGERHEVKAYVDYAYVRPIFFAGLGVVGLVLLLFAARWFWSRRASDAR